MKVIFDLDGTIADVRHRVHFVRDGNRDYESFFAACVDDAPYQHVVDTLNVYVDAGHSVEIWSARDDKVRAETETWLSQVGVNPELLTHMRAHGDTTEDATLKRHWLHQLTDNERPDLIYDDRQRVVDMWREEGIPCFQVTANWEQEDRLIAPVQSPLLTIMVGPSGGGKSTWVEQNVQYSETLSSDALRHAYTGSIKDQTRNEDVFYAIHKLAKARLDCGLPVTIDATNLRRKDRLACLALAPEGAGVRYVVINRSMADKIASSGWRAGVMLGEKTLLEAHEQRFNSQIKDILAGDHMPNVTVVDAREFK